MYWMTRKTKRNIRRAYPRRARNCPLEVQRYCPSSARKTPPALPMTQRGDINHERKTKGHTSKIDRDRRNGKMTRAKAIHYHCIDCMGYQSYEVKKCANTNCPLWEFRMGTKTPLRESTRKEPAEQDDE